MLTRGLSASDGVFASVAKLQAADLKAGLTVAVNDGSTIQFYESSLTNAGSAVSLSNGLFANPVAGSASKLWLLQNNNFTIVVGSKYLVDGSSNIVDIQMPATLSVGDEIIVHNESISTNKVQLVNPNFTIKGPSGTISPGTDLELAPGDTAHLAAKTSLILEVV
jgi:hypothetical protein